MTKIKAKNRKRAAAVAVQRMVGLLVKAAKAQDDLAATYREMEWDLAAETAEQEAREFRRRAVSFREKAKQSNAADQPQPPKDNE